MIFLQQYLHISIIYKEDSGHCDSWKDCVEPLSGELPLVLEIISQEPVAKQKKNY